MPARDISLLLNILCDPNDNLSSIGFLRSPWVNYSDEEIVDKILNKKTVNALDHFEEIYNEIKNSRKDLSKKLKVRLKNILIKLAMYRKKSQLIGPYL